MCVVLVVEEVPGIAAKTVHFGKGGEGVESGIAARRACGRCRVECGEKGAEEVPGRTNGKNE